MSSRRRIRMALTPELEALKTKLVDIGLAKRTSAQDRLLAELRAIDKMIRPETLEEAAFASVTKMTSPGGGSCHCCGR
jgi:hypothetical protein